MDKYINFEKWTSGESPVLFIVGLADDNIEFGKRIRDLENYLKTSK